MSLIGFRFWLIIRNKSSGHIFNLRDGPSILRHRYFNESWPTVLYVHGWNESPYEESVQLVVSAYLQRGEYNTMLLNWEHVACNLYPEAMAGLTRLGVRVADVLLDMFAAGLPLASFHLVGHSLGAQMAGHIGRHIIAKTHHKVKLPR